METIYNYTKRKNYNNYNNIYKIHISVNILFYFRTWYVFGAFLRALLEL